ncbi:hypothetical protein HDV00_011567 [Rhizophlyctis rosea]|nr:hypothetical protein HDV00_011567 [Rhizophlyctis rosea]
MSQLFTTLLASAMIAPQFTSNHLSARQFGSNVPPNQSTTSAPIPACDFVVQSYFDTKLKACNWPSSVPSGNQAILDFTKTVIVSECTIPACQNAFDSYSSQVSSSCPNNYTASVQVWGQKAQIPVATLYPAKNADNSTHNIQDSFQCVKDPSNTKFCFYEFAVNYAYSSTGSTTADQRKADLCNSCTWRVLNSAKNDTATWNSTSSAGVSVGGQTATQESPQQFYQQYSGPVNAACGSDFLTNAANGQAAYTTPDNVPHASSSFMRASYGWSMLAFVVFVGTAVVTI